MSKISLESHGILVKEVNRNLGPARLYEEALRFEKNTSIASSGALIAYSGSKTGRSPQDKRIVKNPASEQDVGGPVPVRCLQPEGTRAPAQGIEIHEEGVLPPSLKHGGELQDRSRLPATARRTDHGHRSHVRWRGCLGGAPA